MEADPPLQSRTSDTAPETAYAPKSVSRGPIVAGVLAVVIVICLAYLYLSGGIGSAAKMQGATTASTQPTTTQATSTYSGTYDGQYVTLTRLFGASTSIEDLPDATQVGYLYNFSTTNSTVACLDGEPILVWTAPNEYPGEYIAHNGNQGTQCAYVTLLFPQSSTVTTPPPQSSTVTTPSASELTFQFSNIANYDNGPTVTLFNGGELIFDTSNDTASVTLSNGTIINFGQLTSICHSCTSGAYAYSKDWSPDQKIEDGIEFEAVFVSNITTSYISFEYPPSINNYAYSANYSAP